MTKTVMYAPVHIIPGKPIPGNVTNNPDAAPGLAWGGDALMDPRWPYQQANQPAAGVNATAPNILGWIGSGAVQTVSLAPAASAANNIAAAQNAVNGTPMALVGASGAGITVLGAATFLIPSMQNAPAGGCVIDGLLGFKKFGQGFQSWYYDPATMSARSVSVTGSTSATGGNFLISGFDLYGFPQTQLLTLGAGAVTANTKKPFKIVTSVVPQFADAHNYSVGVADIFDLGLAADFFPFADLYYGAPASEAVQVASTFTAADTTTPATNLTGGVRGTFTPGSSTDGTKRVDIFVTPSAARIAQAGASNIAGTAMSTGLTGVTPA